MNRSDRPRPPPVQTSSTTSARPPPPRAVSAQLLPDPPSEKLRLANANIGSDVLKQIAARVNNSEEEDSAVCKKRTACNYCLIKSKHNLKGKCLECSIPQVEAKPKKTGFEVSRQVAITLQSSKPQVLPSKPPQLSQSVE